MAQTTIQNPDTCAKTELPKLRQDMPYSKVREMLLDAGWQAILDQENVRHASEKSAQIRYLLDKGYTEVVDCSGAGFDFCLFQFENAYGQILSVVTINNEANEEKIIRWYFEPKETEK